jgi:signal transduction histidine kinase
LNIQRLQKGGSGLGLKIARDLISWLGGEIELIRSNAAGTQFLIVLPRSSTPSSLITEAKN